MPVRSIDVGVQEAELRREVAASGGGAPHTFEALGGFTTVGGCDRRYANHALHMLNWGGWLEGRWQQDDSETEAASGTLASG